MNRTLLAAMTVLIVVLGIALVAYAAQPSGPPEAVQLRSSAFASYLNIASGQNVTIKSIVRAWHPERFEQAMTKASYGDSVYYHASYSLQVLAETGRLGPTTASGQRPLPYPPKDLWCVWLSNGYTIAVAQHQDMYNADWIVHQFNDQATTVAAIGCNLTSR